MEKIVKINRIWNITIHNSNTKNLSWYFNKINITSLLKLFDTNFYVIYQGIDS